LFYNNNMDYLLLTTNDYLLLTDNSKLILSAFSYSNYGWTSELLRIDADKVIGTADLNNFPVLINQDALGTSTFGTAIWSNSQGQEINTNRFLSDANLQGYWRFENDVTDTSSNSYDLTASGTPTYTSGKFNQSIVLNGSSQYAEIADASASNLEISSDQTWSVWVNPDTIPSSYGYRIIHKAKLSNAGNRHEMYIDHNDPGDVVFWLGGLTTNFNVVSSNKVSAGQWNHIAGVYDSSSNKLKVFVNGIKTEATASGTAGDSDANFVIGASRFGSGDSIAQWFDGQIDDIAILDRALSDTEVLEIYKGGADIRFSTDSVGLNELDYEVVNWNTNAQEGEIWVKFGTVQATTNTDFYMWYDNGTATSASNGTAVWSNGFQAVYHLNNGGAAALDSTSNNYTVTAGTSVPAQADGQVGSAVDFEESASEYMSIADASAPNLEIDQDQTWFAWIKPEVMPQNGKRVFGKRNLGKKSILFSSSSPRFELAGLATNENVTSTESLSAGNWYNLVGVYNSTESKIKIYVNKIKTEATASGTATDTNDIFSIAAEGSNGQYFDGVIDEVYITNDAKTDGWIATYYNNTHDPATFFITSTDFTRAISDNLSITDIIYRESNFFRQETNVINLTDDVVRTHDVIATVAQDTIGITDFVDLISLSVIKVAQDVVGITDEVIRQADFSRQNVNTVTATDIINRTADYNRDLSNTITLTDIILGTRILGVSITDTINITDTTTYKKISNQVENPIIKFMQIDEIKPTIYNITNG